MSEAPVITSDDEELSLVSSITDLLRKGIEHHRPHVADVFRTLAFLSDYQFINVKLDGTITPIKNKKKKTLISDNQLWQAYIWLTEQMFSDKPVVTVHAGGQDLADMEAANVASVLADYWRFNCNWSSAEQNAWGWVMTTGMAYIMPVWRKNILRPIKVQTARSLDEPIVTEGPNGLKRFDFVAIEEEDDFEGDITFDVRTTLNTYTYPLSASRWEDVEHIITADVVTPTWIERNINQPIDIDELGITSVTSDEINMRQIERVNRFVNPGFELMNDHDQINKYLLIQYRERPSFANPEGRHVVIIGNRIIHDGPLEYLEEAREIDPNDTLNVSMGFIPWFAWKQTGRLIPTSPIGRLIPSQIRLNKVLTDQARNRESVGRNKIFYDENTIADDAWTDEHGELIKMQPGQDIRTGLHVIPAQTLPGIQGEADMAYRTIENESGRSAIFQGRNPAQVRSAFQLDILREEAQTFIKQYVERREENAQSVFWMTAAITRNRYSNKNIIDIYGVDREAEAAMYIRADFRRDMRVSPGSALPRNKASQEAKMLELWRNQAFIDNETGQPDVQGFWDMLRMGKVNRNVNIRQRHRNRAATENTRMMRGIFQIPFNFEDHDIHLQEHQAFMSRSEFYDMPDELKALFIAHIQLHVQHIEDSISEVAMQNELDDNNAFNQGVDGVQPSITGTPGLEGIIGIGDDLDQDLVESEIEQGLSEVS